VCVCVCVCVCTLYTCVHTMYVYTIHVHVHVLFITRMIDIFFHLLYNQVEEDGYGVYGVPESIFDQVRSPQSFCPQTKPETLNPKPETRNPKLETQVPKP
jgi:hypothetical protein